MAQSQKHYPNAGMKTTPDEFLGVSQVVPKVKLATAPSNPPNKGKTPARPVGAARERLGRKRSR